MTIHATHPDIDITTIIDMRIILNHSRPKSTHILRYSEPSHLPTQSMEFLKHNVSTSEYSDFAYRLRYVSSSLKHEDIKHNLSYYGQIESIQDIKNLSPTQREILIIFDKNVRISLLDHIWAVNIRRYNISMAKAHLTDSQLDYRKLHVAGFKGFNYKTTESQALRVFRPYGGMSCVFHQNLAYIAFRTAEQMHSVCQLRLYTEDNRLLTGCPRVQ